MTSKDDPVTTGPSAPLDSAVRRLIYLVSRDEELRRGLEAIAAWIAELARDTETATGATKKEDEYVPLPTPFAQPTHEPPVDPHGEEAQVAPTPETVSSNEPPAEAVANAVAATKTDRARAEQVVPMDRSSLLALLNEVLPPILLNPATPPTRLVPPAAQAEAPTSAERDWALPGLSRDSRTFSLSLSN